MNDPPEARKPQRLNHSVSLDYHRLKRREDPKPQKSDSDISGVDTLPDLRGGPTGKKAPNQGPAKPPRKLSSEYSTSSTEQNTKKTSRTESKSNGLTTDKLVEEYHHHLVELHKVEEKKTVFVGNFGKQGQINEASNLSGEKVNKDHQKSSIFSSVESCASAGPDQETLGSFNIDKEAEQLRKSKSFTPKVTSCPKR